MGRTGISCAICPPDLKRFQRRTTGHPILLGRKTLATFPGGAAAEEPAEPDPLPQSRLCPGGREVFSALDEALATAPADTFVIGGESLYRQTLDRCDTVYVTKLHRSFPGADRFFPNLDQAPAWVLAEVEGPYVYRDLAYTYCTYRRREA